MQEAILLGIWIVLALAGVFFSVAPPLPGPLVSWCGMLIYRIFSNEPHVDWAVVVVFGAIAVGTVLFDFLSSAIGAKKFGATWHGGLGAILGVICLPILLTPIGLGVLGIIAGPLVGAFIGERLGGNTFSGSAKAGGGAFLAFIAATIVKILVSVVMLATIAFATVFGGSN